MNFDAKNYPPLKDVDNLKERNHSMVLYDNEDYGKSVKYRYIENGLKKGEHSIILTHDDVNSIENEVASCGIDVDNFKRKKLLHIHQIENIMERQDGIMQGFKDIVRQVTADLKPPYRFIGRMIPDVSTREGIEAELKIEHKFHSDFDNYDCSFLCTYNVKDIESARRPIWLQELLANHHNFIYATNPEDAVAFDPQLLTRD